MDSSRSGVSEEAEIGTQGHAPVTQRERERERERERVMPK